MLKENPLRVISRFLWRNLRDQEGVRWYTQSAGKKKKKQKTPANQEYYAQKNCSSEMKENKDISRQTKVKNIHHY